MNHSVVRHMVTVNCQSQEFGNRINDELSDLVQARLYPKLDELFKRYSVENDIWEIQELPVEINLIGSKNWQEEFIEKSLDQIDSYLRTNLQEFSASSPEDVRISGKSLKERGRSSNEQIKKRLMSPQELYSDFLFNYLKKGIISYNSQVLGLEEVFDKIELNQFNHETIKEILTDNFTALLRWTFNVPRGLKLRFLDIDNIVHDLDFSEEFAKEKSSLNKLLEFLYWIGLFNKDGKALSEPNISRIRQLATTHFNVEQEYINKILFVNKTPATDDKLKSQSKSEKRYNEDSIVLNEDLIDVDNQDLTLYISNSGLVLIYPFLLKLFENLKLVKDGDWVSQEKQHRASLILQYLVQGHDKVFETELAFNKLLCGIPISDFVSVDWNIQEEEIEQVNQLLEAVIEHWTAIKNTSIEGLRGSFIKREGKLSLDEFKPPELTVESKSYDILLDLLPWGISMIKTPWMKQHLVCNWN